jgi:hypothetical protein
MEQRTRKSPTDKQLAALSAGRASGGRKPKPNNERRRATQAFLSPLEVQRILAVSGCASFTEFCQGVAAGKLTILTSHGKP